MASVLMTSARTGACSDRPFRRSRNSTSRCSGSRLGAKRPISITVGWMAVGWIGVWWIAVSWPCACASRHVKPAPLRAARPETREARTASAAPRTARPRAYGPPRKIEAALEAAGGSNRGRGSGARPSARSKSETSAGPSRRASPARESRKSPPTVAIPRPSRSPSSRPESPRTSRARGPRAAARVSVVVAGAVPPPRARMWPGAVWGRGPGQGGNPIAIPSRTPPRERLRAAEEPETPWTSRRTSSGGPRLTSGVNCMAQAAISQSASSSARSSRWKTRNPSGATRTGAWPAAIPGPIPSPRAPWLQTRTSARGPAPPPPWPA